MTELGKIDTDELCLKVYELKNRMNSLALDFTTKDLAVPIDEYNEGMTALKITLDVLQAELDNRTHLQSIIGNAGDHPFDDDPSGWR